MSFPVNSTVTFLTVGCDVLREQSCLVDSRSPDQLSVSSPKTKLLAFVQNEDTKMVIFAADIKCF